MFVFQCIRHEQDWPIMVCMRGTNAHDAMSRGIGNWSALTWLPAIGDNLPCENPFLTNQ